MESKELIDRIKQKKSVISVALGYAKWLDKQNGTKDTINLFRLAELGMAAENDFNEHCKDWVCGGFYDTDICHRLIKVGKCENKNFCHQYANISKGEIRNAN